MLKPFSNPAFKEYLPLILLLIAALIVGVFSAQDFGLSWDEPLFYGYADSIPYAYSIGARLDGSFNLEQAFGPSEDDHKNYGPAYLLIARPGALAFQSLGLDRASAWHLINFIFFLIGAALFYSLCRRWIGQWPSLAATALFVTQPVLWGHAFINPKDMPFLVFFIASMALGLRMVDQWQGAFAHNWRSAVFPAIVLGAASSVRVLGPLAGILIALYSFQRHKKMMWREIGLFALIAVVTLFIAWPYLWDAPAQNLIAVLLRSAGNDTQLKVLFNGAIFQADQLPRRYLPVLLAITLTEPVWPLFMIGLGIAAWQAYKKQIAWLPLALIGAWFALPFFYVILRTPPMYDGYRHFLFILPPIFLFAGFAFEQIQKYLKQNWLNALIVLILLAPGVYADIHLHPYEYTYYNSIVGGAGGAFRKYETDYWLTCYKEVLERVNASPPANKTIYIQREIDIAQYYAGALSVRDLKSAQIAAGDWMLFSTRANLDQVSVYRKAPEIFSVGRDGAVFCVVKQFK
jgi:hypothetical protein